MVSEENCITEEPEIVEEPEIAELAEEESILVPTLSQWGLLIFALLILNICVGFIKANEKILYN